MHPVLIPELIRLEGAELIRRVRRTRHDANLCPTVRRARPTR